MPDNNNLEEERFGLSLGFREFSLWSAVFSWFHCFGPEVKQNSMATGHGRGDLLISEKLEGEREESAREKINPSRACPTDLFPPTRTHLPVV